MMQWLRNNPPPVMERRIVEPGATFSLFENHWKQAMEVMDSSQDADAALTVISHLSQMISFLRVSRGELNTETSCKGFWLQNQCSEKVIKWLHNLQINGLQLPPDYELKLVAVLHSLCEVASRDGEILGYENGKPDKQDWDGAYSLASLLLEYSLRSDPQLGDTARYSFILLIQLASKFSGLEKSLTQESGLGLTNVVISGLSACFSQLPTFTNSSPEQLEAFIVQLKFVQEVTEASSENVASTIAECFKNAFLLSVIQPALTQSLHEEIAVVTKYLQIVCEHLTHPSLNRRIIQFIIAKLLPTLIQRLNHMNVSITIATLRLFTVLFEFYCEDFWYSVILRYLVTQNHLMVSQREFRLPDIDFHDSSVRFLALLPENVVEALGAETLTNHYVQYLNSESERFANVDSMVSMIPSNFIAHGQAEQDLSDENDRTSVNESTNRNDIYPFWKYKYDGTDYFEKSGRKRSVEEIIRDKHSESIPTENKFEESQSTNSSVDPLTQNQSGLQFTTINLLQPGPEDELRPTMTTTTEVPSYVNKMEITPLSVATNSSEGYASMDSCSSPVLDGTAAYAQIASFGPFLDSIFVKLSCWENQNPDVILVLSELVSVLASSRIPLINTILLDPNLTLQPSYVTFMSLLKRIRDDLDHRMRPTCSLKVIADTWNAMNLSNVTTSGKDSSNSRRISLSSTSNMALSSTIISDNFGENLRKRISGGGTGVGIVSALQSVFSRKSSSPAPSPKRPEQNHSANPQGHRKQMNQPDVGRILATRAIIFSHWLLELGAISQQLCWKRK